MSSNLGTKEFQTRGWDDSVEKVLSWQIS